MKMSEKGSAFAGELYRPSPFESQSVVNGANPAVIRLEDLSDVLQMSHLVILCIHFITAVS